jgi:hypothetical protein
MKNFMRLSRLVVTAVVSLGVTISCSKEYDDSSLWSKLESHESRLSALEQQCSRMNSDLQTLSSLVNALSASDMVTSVVPIMEGETQVGWTIEFTHRAPISIFNGKDGADGRDGVDGAPGRDGVDGTDGANGTDGADGRCPLIGIAAGSDGNWYWTLDGEWLLSSSGERIRANGSDGQDGTDGTPGKDGSNGADGVTPLLKIEEGSWYVTYDKGTSWQYLGKASESQPSGCLILSISESDDSVTFNLASGQMVHIPKFKAEEPLEIILVSCDGKVQAGGSLEIQFTLAHCKGEVIVKAIVDGGWKASVHMEGTSGAVRFQAPDYSDNCEAVLIAQDERRCAVIAIIPLVSEISGEAGGTQSPQGYAVAADGESLRIFIADTSFIMNRVHAGTFTMGDGTQYENQGAKYGYTNPKHKVTLTKDFWITESALGESLLTEFQSIDTTLIEYAGGSYVHNARNFIDIRNVESVLSAICKDCSLPFRLPTEAEAEYHSTRGKAAVEPRSAIGWHSTTDGSAGDSTFQPTPSTRLDHQTAHRWHGRPQKDARHWQTMVFRIGTKFEKAQASHLTATQPAATQSCSSFPAPQRNEELQPPLESHPRRAVANPALHSACH